MGLNSRRPAKMSPRSMSGDGIAVDTGCRWKWGGLVRTVVRTGATPLGQRIWTGTESVCVIGAASPPQLPVTETV